MKKWDPAYTRAIVVVLVFAVLFSLAFWLDNRAYRFEGSEAVAARLEDWTPAAAIEGEAHGVDGEILYYSIDCFKPHVIGREYVGPEQAVRRFLKSDVKTEADIGVIAALYCDRVFDGSYTNGAGSFRIQCTCYILDKDTLAVLARDSVSGGAPSSTTSGGDRYGSPPSKAKCLDLAKKLVAGLS